jgi:hypothetical protein
MQDYTGFQHQDVVGIINQSSPKKVSWNEPTLEAKSALLHTTSNFLYGELRTKISI